MKLELKKGNNTHEKSVGSIADMMQDNAPKYFEEYIPEAEILQKQIDSPNVCNIAVSAAYGAGKSSVIKTYLELYRNRKTLKCKKIGLSRKIESTDKNKQGIDVKENSRTLKKRETCKKQFLVYLQNKITTIRSIFYRPDYLRISLASFEDKKYDEDAVERSVLQQMLYSTSRRRLPKSKIERIDKTGILATVVYALLLCSAMVGVIALSLHIAQKIVLHEKLLLATSIITPLLIVFFVVDLMYFGRLKHIKYKEFEVALSDKDSKSVPSNLINKFLNEVLYFFECSKIDLVIFEDLDRLKCEVVSDNNKTNRNLPLLVKLRELNTLINNSSKCKRKVTFVYAVKDDYFSDSEERAKFFDFILPIVPAINPNTAAVKLQNRLDNLDKKMSLSQSFVNEIAIYIPDMRTLTNTVNEYVLMYKHLFDQDSKISEKIINENLFALCLYKSLYSADYALLQSSQTGLLASLINMDALNKKAITEIEQQITEKQKMISKIKAEWLENFEEIKTMFVGEISLKYRSTQRASVGAVYISDIKSFMDIDFQQIRHPSDTYYAISFGGDAERNRVREQYISYEQRLNDKLYGKIYELDDEITRLELEKKKSRHRSLKDAVKLGRLFEEQNRDYFDNILSEFEKKTIFDNNVAKQALEYIKYLIRREHIDENYMDYISPHALGSLSANDMAFIRKIRAGEICYDYKLDNVKIVISNLADKDFSEMGMLHPLLMANLNEIKQIDRKHGGENLKKAVEVYSLQNDLIDEIILNFITEERSGSVRNFFRYVLPERKSLANDVLTSDADLEKKDLLLQCAIEFCEHYAEYDEDSCLKKYCESHSKYMNLFSACTEYKVLRFLGEIQPKFECLLPHRDGSIYKKIVNENLFKITTDNLLVALNLGDNQESFYKKNLALIKETSPSIEKYVRENLADYVGNVLLDVNVTGEEEDENEIIDILKSDIDADLKKQIIQKYNFCITDVSEFSADLHQSVVENNKMKPSWSNINCVSKTIDFTSVIEFMIINAESIYGEFNLLSDKDQIDLMKKIATSQLKDSDITLLLKAIDSMDKQVSLSLISGGLFTNEGLLLLLRNGNLQFDSTDWKLISSLTTFKKEYFNKFDEDIIKNPLNFFKCAGNSKEIVLIISDKYIPTVIKQQLLKSLGSFNVAEDIANGLCVALRENKLVVHSGVVTKICSCSISTIDKLNIINMNLHSLSYNDLLNCLNHLGEPYSRIVSLKPDETLVDFDYDLTDPIIDKLKDHGHSLKLNRGKKQKEKGFLHFAN